MTKMVVKVMMIVMGNQHQNQFPKEGLVVAMVGKQRKYSMEQADIPNIRYWITNFGDIENWDGFGWIVTKQFV